MHPEPGQCLFVIENISGAGAEEDFRHSPTFGTAPEAGPLRGGDLLTPLAPAGVILNGGPAAN